MQALTQVAEFVVSSLPVSGFEFNETMSGTHRFVERRRDKGELPFSFSARAWTDQLRELLHPETREFFRCTVDGTITVDGLATAAPLAGGLEMSLLRKRQIIYDFTFKADNGVAHRFYGHKDLSIFQPLKSLTTLYGEITNAKTGKVVSTSVAYLDMRDVPGLFGSFKLR